MKKFRNLTISTSGEKIEVVKNQLKIPNQPIIPFIEGDGIGKDITKVSQKVLDSAVSKAYNGQKKIAWLEIFAGEKAYHLYKEYLPKETIQAIKYFVVAIKGPLTTPIAGGYRSLNVTLRQVLNLYACIRPVKYIPGVPAPVKHPEDVDIVIFRENTEDVYAGLEWPKGSKEAKKLISFLNKNFKTKVRLDSGIGIKPISVTATKRLVRKAIFYALEYNRPTVTLIHKGNIMKYTEGAFRDWGYEVAKKEFRNKIVTEEEVEKQYGGTKPEGKILINDRIADNIFQQILIRPKDYSVLAAPNLNGDYLSDAAAAQVGGLGLAPGANIGDHVALFEATHGTAPKYAGLNMANPSSLILSGVMMLEYLGWKEAADLVRKSLEETIRQKKVTYDLERMMEGATRLSTSQFCEAIISNM
ncbi:MAG TPA: isocitrate dehydrogenase (NADP(+)) [candidate division Zixibacteria bacterium]|nr:isocitrate dehydrogenase (NADP(+)) [candidate division Zixibacteria bacterium]